MKTLCEGNSGSAGCKADYAVSVNQIMPDYIEKIYNKLHLYPVKAMYTVNKVHIVLDNVIYMNIINFTLIGDA
jgi:hypothetical protein